MTDVHSDRDMMSDSTNLPCVSTPAKTMCEDKSITHITKESEETVCAKVATVVESDGTIPEINELKLSDNEDDETLLLQANNLKVQGNEMFKSSDYSSCVTIYSKALEVCPARFSQERAILFANRAAAYLKLDELRNAVDDCTEAIKLDSTYLKAYLRRASLYEKLDELDLSLEDYKHIVEKHPDNNDAKFAVHRLSVKIEERNEKLKTEMMGKLTSLGDVILKPFGLSTSNFKVQQDPNSGGYSINFKQ